MSDEAPRKPVYRIPDWETKYENNRTRGMKRARWWPCPNRFDDDDYLAIVNHPQGVALLAAWRSIQTVASACHPRGTLLRRGQNPHDSTSLAAKTGLPKLVFDDAIPLLLQMGLLAVDAGIPTTSDIPQESAARGQLSDLDPAPSCTERKGIELSSNARAIPATRQCGTGSTAAAAVPPVGAEEENRRACVTALGDHRLETAGYLLDEFPNVTPELVHLAMKGLSARAKTGARVEHFRQRMPKVIQETRERAERQREAQGREDAKRAAEAAEDERKAERRAFVKSIIDGLSDEELAAYKGRILKGANRREAAFWAPKDPRASPALAEEIVRLIEADTGDSTGDETKGSQGGTEQ